MTVKSRDWQICVFQFAFFILHFAIFSHLYTTLTGRSPGPQPDRRRQPVESEMRPEVNIAVQR